jgi:hypothetical protein
MTARAVTARSAGVVIALIITRIQSRFPGGEIIVADTTFGPAAVIPPDIPGQSVPMSYGDP